MRVEKMFLVFFNVVIIKTMILHICRIHLKTLPWWSMESCCREKPIMAQIKHEAQIKTVSSLIKSSPSQFLPVHIYSSKLFLLFSLFDLLIRRTFLPHAYLVQNMIMMENTGSKPCTRSRNEHFFKKIKKRLLPRLSLHQTAIERSRTRNS